MNSTCDLEAVFGKVLARSKDAKSSVVHLSSVYELRTHKKENKAHVKVSEDRTSSSCE